MFTVSGLYFSIAALNSAIAAGPSGVLMTIKGFLFAFASLIVRSDPGDLIPLR